MVRGQTANSDSYFRADPDITVVTREVVSASPKKINIPNACLALSVKYVNPYEMLRPAGARFVLP